MGRVAGPGTDGGDEGKGAGGASVSMVLTSIRLRCCTPERNRIIPRISIGHFDVGLIDVSAVDTGLPVGSTPRDLGAGAGRSHPGAGLTLPCPAPPDPFEFRLSVPAAPTQHRPQPAPAPRRSTARGWGSTGRGLCLLHEYCTKAPPTWSTPDPPSVDPHSRASQARHRPSHCEQPNQPRPAQRARTIGGRSARRTTVPWDPQIARARAGGPALARCAGV